ncbi:MAG: hypothetical protein WCO51_02850 [bacterium]|jgi:hypothetical protein
MVDIGRWLNAGWEAFQRNAAAFVIATIVGYLLGMVTCGILFPVMLAGWALMALKALKGEKVEIGDLFKPFDKFGTLFILWVLLFVITIVIYGIMFASAFIPILGILMLLVYLVLFALTPLVSFVVYFAVFEIVDRGTDAMKALTNAWNVVQKNMAMFWVAGLVLSIVSSIGSVVVVGILVTLPIAMIAFGAAYMDNYGVAGAPQVPPTTPTPTPPAPMAPPEEPPII